MKLISAGVAVAAFHFMLNSLRCVTSVLPPFALMKNLPKPQGVDVAVDYKHLNNKQKQSRGAWHVEMESQHIQYFDRLLEVCKDYGVMRFWGGSCDYLSGGGL